MPIQIACPECGKKYRFPDERAGSAVDCKECGAEIELPGGNKRRAKSRDDDDDDVQSSPKRRRPGKSGRTKKSKAGSNTGLMIGGGIGAVLVVGLLVVFLMRPANKPQPAGDPATPNGSAPNVAPGTAGSTPAAPTVVAKGWKAKIDPPAVPYPADQVTTFKIDVKGTYGLNPNLVTYPDVASPFALIGEPGPVGKRPRQLWNLATGLKVRDIAPSKRSPYKSGLGADGKLLAWYRHDEGGGLDVYDMEADKILVSIPLPSAQINVGSVSLPTNQRLVVTSNVHRKLMTWKLPSGEAERTISLGENAQPSDFLAFSPGGQYLAFTGDFLTQSLQVYDLNSGELAGTIEFSERMANKSLIGLDFSPDGKELAAAFGQNHGATSDRVLIWNMADGATVADFSLPDPDQRPLDIGGARPSLQWFPDRKRLLQNGQHVIDRDARRVVFSLPPPSLDYNSGLVRRVLSNSVIAAFEGVKDTGTLAPLELKDSDVARAREIASSGGMVIDARLPKLTSFDRKRATDKTAIDKTWKVQPDPGPNAATLAASIPIADAKGWVRELKFSRLDSARAALRLADGEDTTKALLHLSHPRVVPVEGSGRVRRRYAFGSVTCRQNWLELFDLAQGKSVGPVEIGFPCELVALSPNGSRALVAPMEGQGRLDVFSVPEGTHLAGCRLFGDAAKPEHRDIEAAVFIDENTIAACSRNDQLVVFKLPGCDPVYAVQDAGLATVSPGGKLLATCAEGKIEFRDALTGDGRGSAQLGGEAVALSFSSKGDRLAVLTSGNSGSQLNVIELKDGTVSNLSIPAALGPLLWVGDQQVLVGAEKASDLIQNKGPSTIDRYMMLVDLRRQTVLWSYDYGTKDRVTFGRSTVDGRLWVAGAAKRGGALKLTALALPEPSIAARLDDKTLDSQVAVKPGMTISLQFGLTDPPELPGFAQQVRGLVDGAVRNNGLNIKDGQPITLVASATVANAQGTMKLETLSGTTNKPPATVNIQPKNLTIRMAYESNGKTLWESKQVVTNASIGLVFFDNKSPQQAVDEQMWKQAVDVFRLAQPPSNVLAGATIRGLGTSRLAGDGAYPPE